MIYFHPENWGEDSSFDSYVSDGLVKNHPTHGDTRELWRMERRNDLLKRRLEWLEGKEDGFSACRNRKINMQIVSFEFSCVIHKSNHQRSCNSHCSFEMKSKWKFLEPILGIVRSRPQMNEFIQSECSGVGAARATCTIVHLKIY